MILTALPEISVQAENRWGTYSQAEGPWIFKRTNPRNNQSSGLVVRSWLVQHAARDLSIPRDGSPLLVETQDRVKEFRRQLGAQGWLRSFLSVPYSLPTFSA